MAECVRACVQQVCLPCLAFTLQTTHQYRLLFVRLFVFPVRPPLRLTFDESEKSSPWHPSLRVVPAVLAYRHHCLTPLTSSPSCSLIRYCSPPCYGRHLSCTSITILIPRRPLLPARTTLFTITRPCTHKKYSPMDLVSAASWKCLTTGRLTSCRFMLRSPGPDSCYQQPSQANSRLLLAE